MVTKSKKSAGEKKGRVKVGKLQLNKETIKELTDKEVKRIKGGLAAVERITKGKLPHGGC